MRVFFPFFHRTLFFPFAALVTLGALCSCKGPFYDPGAADYYAAADSSPSQPAYTPPPPRDDGSTELENMGFAVSGAEGNWTIIGYSGEGTSLVIPAGYGVTGIGESVFAGSLFTDVRIPDGVTRIADQAFFGCAGLVRVICESPVPPALGAAVFDNCHNGLRITVPQESLTVYRNAPGWSAYTDKIQSFFTTATGQTR
jgi:hypothetical protein